MCIICHIIVSYILHIFAESSTIDALLQSSFKVQEPRRGYQNASMVNSQWSINPEGMSAHNNIKYHHENESDCKTYGA